MSDLGFYGKVLLPGKKVTVTPAAERVLRISSVAIGNKKELTEEPTQLRISKNHGDFLVVCTLSKRIPHANLDLFFIAGQPVEFQAFGKATLHITGYSTFLDEEPESSAQTQQKKASAQSSSTMDDDSQEGSDFSGSEDDALFAKALKASDSDSGSNDDDEQKQPVFAERIASSSEGSSDESSSSESENSARPIVKKKRPITTESSPSHPMKKTKLSSPKGGKVTCNKCGKVCNSQIGYESHMKDKHGK